MPTDRFMALAEQVALRVIPEQFDGCTAGLHMFCTIFCGDRDNPRVYEASGLTSTIALSRREVAEIGRSLVHMSLIVDEPIAFRMRTAATYVTDKNGDLLTFCPDCIQGEYEGDEMKFLKITATNEPPQDAT